MENFSDFNGVDEPMELPPGFRFHPTDEELITHYLSPKVVDTAYTTRAIGDVDLNKVEPWDLPWMAKMGEKEWYFFCVRDRKYPTGLRTNRATEAGYWKATGKDKEIYRANFLVGMKKTLVFYGGRAPRGEKTNWVMHEYRLEGNTSMHNPPKSSKNEWVICIVFKKSSGGKKVHISGLLRTRNCNSQSSDLPPLMELSSDSNPGNNITATEKSNVTCFSHPTEDPRDKFVEEFSSCSTKNYDIQQFPFAYTKDSTPNSSYSSQNIPFAENLGYRDSVSIQDQSILRFLLENNGKQVTKPEFSEDMIIKGSMPAAMFNQEMGFKPCEDQEFQFISTGPVDLDCLWNY